jgi:hypothetical protein
MLPVSRSTIPHIFARLNEYFCEIIAVIKSRRKLATRVKKVRVNISQDFISKDQVFDQKIGAARRRLTQTRHK